MGFNEKINELLRHFENMVFKEAQNTSQQTQLGTTELFFDSAENQMKYAKIIQSQDSAPGKALMSYWLKNNTPTSFKLEIIADPGKGARWNLQVLPKSLTNIVAQGLNIEYQKLMKQGMVDRLKTANEAAKAGNGSGTLEVGSLELT